MSNQDLRKKRCANCGKVANTICGKCHARRYCSGKCQKKDWIAQHKVVCGTQKEPITYTLDYLKRELNAFTCSIDRTRTRKPVDPVVFTVLSGDSDGSVQCIMSPRYREPILGNPNFPQPIYHPKTPLHLVTTFEGNRQISMHATQELAPGECVFAERPLLFSSPLLHCPDPTKEHDILKTYPPGPMALMDHKIALLNFYSETYFEEAINGGTMDPERRKAYLDFQPPPPPYGPPPGMRKMIDPFSYQPVPAITQNDLEGKQFYGVCQVLSKAKNSCSPNCYIGFDLPTFSFKLLTVRKVAKGEELTVARIAVGKKYAERSHMLTLWYGRPCECTACLQGALADVRRTRALKDPELEFTTEIERWCTRPSLPDDYYLKIARERMRRIEEEKLEAAEAYVVTLTYLMRSHLALGEMEEALVVQKRLMGLAHGSEFESETFKGKVNLMKELAGSREELKKLPIWRARVEKRLIAPPKETPKVIGGWNALCPHGQHYIVLS